MLWLLVLPLSWLGVGGVPQEPYRADAASLPIRPHIYYCRSPNMETFTCWWHPLDNGSQGEDNVTYTLTYTIGKQPPKECPDYVTGGPDSCYFDVDHTLIWEVYCMNVTARGRQGTFTSREHCLDVAEIVEIDPPLNLTYTLGNASQEESGRTALVSWLYPIPSHVHIGWITLVYELRYRPVSESHNWKVKGLLREPHLELLDLPEGTYEVMVRCRSRNNHLWSKWSTHLLITVPSTHTPDRMLALILATGVGFVAFLVIGFGIIPQSKRFKALLLPPIPKPRIRGIDPMLLRKGKIDDINRHLSSFHGYQPPQCCEESWYQESLDESLSLQGSPVCQGHGKGTPGTQRPICPPEGRHLLQTGESAAPHQSPTPYCECSLEVAPPPQSPLWVWPTASSTHPELVPFPGMDYMILNPAPMPGSRDFYTCVNEVSPDGAVHLIPRVPDALKNSNDNGPYLQLEEEGSEKNSQRAAHVARQTEDLASGGAVSPGEAGSEPGEFAMPLQPRPAGRI